MWVDSVRATQPVALAVAAWLKRDTAMSCERAARAAFRCESHSVCGGSAGLRPAAQGRIRPRCATIGRTGRGFGGTHCARVARQVAANRNAVRALRRMAPRAHGNTVELVRRSSDVITILDVDGTIRYASPSMTSVLGRDTRGRHQHQDHDALASGRHRTGIAISGGPRTLGWAARHASPHSHHHEARMAHRAREW